MTELDSTGLIIQFKSMNPLDQARAAQKGILYCSQASKSIQFPFRCSVRDAYMIYVGAVTLSTLITGSPLLVSLLESGEFDSISADEAVARTPDIDIHAFTLEQHWKGQQILGWLGLPHVTPQAAKEYNLRPDTGVFYSQLLMLAELGIELPIQDMLMHILQKIETVQSQEYTPTDAPIH